MLSTSLTELKFLLREFVSWKTWLQKVWQPRDNSIRIDPTISHPPLPLSNLPDCNASAQKYKQISLVKEIKATFH